ncbi:MAG: sodium:alanine symporter family protein, partial [Oceanospirillaceae bacterium]|nr:sodium:alanine symporter family protein [Oceanospirillaceae bacterium]
MDALTEMIKAINGIVWGPMMLVLILGVGLFLQLGLKLMPIFKLGTGFKLMWGGRKTTGADKDSGEISPFQALMTAMSATVGTGNIAGVATAVFLGGPGALFWMWCTALVGMATKFSEAVLAVKYREVDENGNHVGGPMYYIKNGLGKKWAWMGTMFAVFGTIAGFGIGNTVQSNSVASVLEANFSIPLWVTGIVLMVLT